MLLIPSFRRIGDLTVYQDDAQWTRFYPLPSIPRVRLDRKGRPVFLLTLYHFSDQEREANPEAARGGGFMNFDVQLAPEPAALEAARTELQAWVDEEYARRRADPTYSGRPEYAQEQAPRVEFADPLLCGGTVRMDTTQSDALVTRRLAESNASLVAGSNAAFNVDLTENGASFMKQLLTEPGGDGRTDLTPVAVGYDLRMWARLPPVTITVTGDSSRIQSTLKSLSEQRGDNPCTPFEIETFRENTVNSARLVETGAVEVRIDKGDALLPEEAVTALQDYALQLFDTMLAERFLAPADGDTRPLSFDDARPATPTPAPAGALVLRPWRAFLWGSQVGRYKVQETLNEANMHLSIRIERSQVVEWPMSARATLETFFAGMSAAEIGRHVVELRTEDFDTLGVTVRCFVDFAKTPFQAVEVQLEYSADDDRGQTHVTPASFTFSAANADTAQRFDPSVIGGRRDYRYRWCAIYDDGTRGEPTPWQSSTSRALNLAVADPGGLDLEVSAATLNWDLLRSVRVDLGYTDPQDSTVTAQRSFELTKLVPSRRWQQSLRRTPQSPVSARITYFLADEKVLEGPNLMVDATQSLLPVPPPQVDVLNVTLMPSGDWSEVVQALVQTRYDAGEGRIYDRVFRFTAIDQLADWAVLLRDATQRSFSYKTTVSYKSGSRDESPWVTATGDQAVPIEAKGVPKLRVNVHTVLVDFARTPVVQVDMSYGEQHRTLAFTEKKAQAFEAPLAADSARDYGYEITWFPASGAPIRSGLQRGNSTELAVTAAVLPTAGKLEIMVRGFAVDFTATPFVDVALAWQDGAREERKTVVLTKDKPMDTWSVDIGDRSQRRYRYAVTYNLADGTRVPGASGETDDPVVSVTRRPS